jgi:hypothetical protein
MAKRLGMANEALGCLWRIPPAANQDRRQTRWASARRRARHLRHRSRRRPRDRQRCAACRARRRSSSPLRLRRLGLRWRIAAGVRRCCGRSGSRSPPPRGGASRSSSRCRARRRRFGPRLGCGRRGSTGAYAIRSSYGTSSRPAACSRVWRSGRRRDSRPMAIGRGSWRLPCGRA